MTLEIIESDWKKNGFKVTFKGDGKMTEDQTKEWDRGYDDGRAFALKYFVNGFSEKEWPDGWNLGFYGNGYAEGQLSGTYASLRRDFPPYDSFSSNGDTIEIIFKDGTKKTIKRNEKI